MRTNYMYGRVKKTLLQEIFALTLCLWIKAGAGPGLGTPFSYSAPGQANELVLIEWGNNPMELLVNDKVRETLERLLNVESFSKQWSIDRVRMCFRNLFCSLGLLVSRFDAMYPTMSLHVSHSPTLTAPSPRL